MAVPWIFAFITLSSSLGIKIGKLKDAVVHPAPLLVSLLIIQIILPSIAYGVGTLFFGANSLTAVGMLIAFVIPTGVISLMWVSIYKGNSSVSLLIVLVNTLLSPVLIPFSLQLFAGATIDFNTFALMKNLIFMIVIPSILGILINYLPFTQNKDIKGRFAPFSKLGLLVVIAVNSSVAAPVISFNWELLQIIIAMFFLSSIGYGLGMIAANWLRVSNEIKISLLYNCGMRNVSVGATIAILYFPPEVAVPVIAATLLQQILAANYGRILVNYLKKNELRREGELKKAAR